MLFHKALWQQASCSSSDLETGSAVLLLLAVALALQVTEPFFLQIMQWLKLHGDAAQEVDATFLRHPWEQHANEVEHRSWPRYLHGVNVLPVLLPNLQHLSLSCEKGFMTAEQDLCSLQFLTCLQSLRLNIASDGSWNRATMSPLQHLTALRQLDMEVHGMETGPMSLAPELGTLTLLTNLSLHQAWSYRTKCTYESNQAGVVIGCLTGLQSLSLISIVDRIPAAFSKLQQLRTLIISGDGEEWPSFSVQPSFSSCRNLSFLQLQSFMPESQAGWLEACSALSALPSLSDIFMKCVDLGELEAHEWAFGSTLTSLRISDGCLWNFPEALVSLTALQHLSFDSTSLEHVRELPVGPYLEHLTGLDLSDTKLPVFPEALFQASKLRVFAAFDDEPWLCLDKLKAVLPRCCELDIIKGSSDPE